MKSEFSEFTYGFTVSYEIMNALRPEIIGVPLFPSLRLENRVGFDASFEPVGWPLFLQFKSTEYLSRPNATFFKSYGCPYFRIAVHRRKYSNQHNLLRALSAIEPEVYYAAPLFHRQSDFDKAFVNDKITAESMFIPLSNLPDLVDDAQHHVMYCREKPGYRWHSNHDTFSDQPISGDHFLRRWKQRATTHPPGLGEAYFRHLRSTVVEIIDKQLHQPLLESLPVNMASSDPTTVIRDLRYLLAVHFGLEVIILLPSASVWTPEGKAGQA